MKKYLLPLILFPLTGLAQAATNDVGLVWPWDARLYTPSLTFDVQRCNVLSTNPSWTTLASVPATNGAASYYVRVATNSDTCYFRLRVWDTFNTNVSNVAPTTLPAPTVGLTR